MLQKIRQAILVIGDIVVAYLSLFLTVLFGFWGGFTWRIFYLHLFPFSIVYLVWLVILYIFDLYNLNISRDKLLFYPRLIESLATSALAGIAFFYLWPALGISPKTNLIFNLIFFGSLILLWRKIFYKLFSQMLLTKIAIIGQSQTGQKLAKEILARPYLGYSLVKIYQINQKSQAKQIIAEAKKQSINLLIAGSPIENNDILSKIFYQCLENKIDFLDLSQAYENICRQIPLSILDKRWFLKNLNHGKKIFGDKIKRLFDLFFANLLLILTSPLWLIVALAIKITDKGPIFYKQKRVGKDKKEFYLIKFRSMKPNAEKQGKAQWAEKDDPRITKIGRIIRRSHLDELPQTINILKGQLSLVGPRPERPEFVKKLEKEIPHYNLRHLIKPGLTGWDQLKFKYARTILDNFEKFEYDLYYLKNRNILLDFGIMLKTFQSFFRKVE